MISHFDLCKKTAERFLSDHDIVLYEYQSYVSGEHPDVLCFNGAYTTLFEIKTGYQDFKKDNQKDCRLKYNVKYFPRLHSHSERFQKIIWGKGHLEEFIRESPHLGRKRYYVCPKGMIQPDEVRNGWGLYWWNGRFYKKKESKVFRNNLHSENNLLSHAFRKYVNDKHGIKNILVKEYK